MKTKLLALVLLYTTFIYAQIPTNDLIGSYYFNNGSPHVGSSGTENFTPSVATATSQVTDRNGGNNAIEFNNALFRSNLDFAQGTTNVNMHYSFWIKTNQSDANERTIIDDSGRSGANFSSTDRGYFVFLKQGKVYFKAQFRDANNNYTPIEFSTDVTVNDNNWHHIALNVSQVIVNTSYDFVGEFYVDNVLQQGAINQPFTGGNVVSFDRNGDVTLNNNKDRNLPPANRFNGQLDDLHIYNRTLSTAEQTSIFNDDSNGISGTNPTSLPAIFSYSFNPNANFVNDETSTVDLTQNGASIIDIADRDAIANSAISIPSGANLTRPNISITGTNESNQFSYSFWLKTTINDGNRRTIIDDSNRSGSGFTGNERGYFFYILNGNVGARVRFRSPLPNSVATSVVSRGVESTNVNIADGNWHHVVFTINNEDAPTAGNDWEITT